MIIMGIVDNVLQKARGIGSKPNGDSVSRLLDNSDTLEAEFYSEIATFGIEKLDVSLENCYLALGIGFTDSQDDIKSAYEKALSGLNSAAQNSDSARKRQAVEYAYFAIGDEQSKSDYDLKFSKGNCKISQYAPKLIYNCLLNFYTNAKNKDIDEYNERSSGVQELDTLTPLIEKMARWEKRYGAVTGKMFEKFWRLSEKTNRLLSENQRLVKAENDKTRANALKENMAALQNLEKAFQELTPMIHTTIETVAHDIMTDENNFAHDLRKSIQVSSEEIGRQGPDHGGGYTGGNEDE